MALLSFGFGRKKKEEKKETEIENASPETSSIKKGEDKAEVFEEKAPVSQQKKSPEQEEPLKKTLLRSRRAPKEGAASGGAILAPGALSPMTKIVEETKTPPKLGDLIEGKVIDIHKSALYIEIPPFGTGIIYGREFINARDLLKKVGIGDTITAKVVDAGNEDGYIELSVKEARQALVWSEAEEAITKKTIFELPIKAANKGGLILEWQGIQGFLPASQLKAEHYPRVEDGNKDRILEELQKFVNTKMAVCILAANPKEGKLIFSEKEPEQKEKSELVEKYKVGDIVDGEVTGIVDFGLFVKVENGLEGLVHISEMDWGLVEDPRAMFKIGEKVKAQIIEIKEGKISLSIKALKENPWSEAKKKYKQDDTVEGVVIKYNRHGALVSIEEGVAGLVHISEFKNDETLKEILGLGKRYLFKIKLFDPDAHRMTLSWREANASAS